MKTIGRRVETRERGLAPFAPHSNAIEQLRQTGNPRAFHIHLGHACPLMTMTYLFTMTAEEALRIQQLVDLE